MCALELTVGNHFPLSNPVAVPVPGAPNRKRHWNRYRSGNRVTFRAMKSVTVELPAASPVRYDVMIAAGLVNQLATQLSRFGPSRRWAMISDSTVADAIGEGIAQELQLPLFRFPAGEANKTVETWAALSSAVLAAGFGRDSGILALGGGVTGDLAGFVAATYMRGIPVVQVPSTLLAMIDASIGGKTGLDTPEGKNLIGAFHQPLAVLVDPDLLRSLPEPELRSGLAEAIKHGAIADPAYLQFIQSNVSSIMARDPAALQELVARSVEIKVLYVNKDPFEAGPRAALNFGHTVGHALERVLNYTLHHGHAVAIGMVAEARIGEALGVTAPGTAETIRAVLEAAGLPAQLPAQVDVARVIAATSTDKKARAGNVRYTLLARIGEVGRAVDGGWTNSVDSGVVEACLDQI